MNKTEIVRKVDSFGRIVIPKSFRYKLNIDFGDEVDFYLDEDSITIKKVMDEQYSSIHENFCLNVAKITGMDCCFMINDSIVITSSKIVTKKIKKKSYNKLCMFIASNDSYDSTLNEKPLYLLDRDNEYMVKKILVVDNGLFIIVDNQQDSEIDVNQNMVIDALLKYTSDIICG